MSEKENTNLISSSISGSFGTGSHSSHLKLSSSKNILVAVPNINIDRCDVLIKCLIYFEVASEINIPHCFRISRVNSDDTTVITENIDYGVYEETDSGSDIKRLVFFDITEDILKDTTTHYYRITSTSSSTFYFLSTPLPYLEIQYVRPFAYYDKHRVFSNNVGENLSYSVDLNTSLLTFKKVLFNDVLPYELALVYDDFENSLYDCFPKRFKLSIFEKLVFNSATSITYIDGNYRRYPLKNTSLSGVYFFDEFGSGLILEPLSNGTYKLFTDSSNSYKLFNSSGLLISIVDEFNRMISLTYQSLTSKGEIEETKLPPFAFVITITDYLGNLVYIKRTMNSITIKVGTSETNYLYLYTINLSSNAITSIKENDSVRTTAISYFGSNNRLSSVNEYSKYSIYFSYGGNQSRLSEVIEKYQTQTTNDTAFDFQILSVNITNNDGVITRYVFEETGELITSGEIKNNETFFLSYQSNEEISNFSLSLTDLKGIEFETSTPSADPDNVDNVLFSFNSPSSVHYHPLSVEANKKYFIYLLIVKSGNQPLKNKNNKPLLTIFDQGNEYKTFEYYINGNIGALIKPITFSSNCDFSDSNPRYTFSLTAPTGGNLLSYDAKLMIVECKGYLDETVMGFNNSEPSISLAPFFGCVINNHFYYGLKLNDLTSNYLNKKRNKPFFWNKNKHELIYVSTYPSEYVFCSYTLFEWMIVMIQNLTNINLQNILNLFPDVSYCDIDTTLFGLNSIEKFVNNPNSTPSYYPVYRLTYTHLVNGNLIICDKKTSNNTSLSKYAKYDSYSRLLELSDSNNAYTRYSYDNYDNVISKQKGNSSYSTYSEINYAYDSRNRLVTISHLVDNATETITFQYDSIYLSPISKAINNTVLEEYEFDNDHRNVTSVSNGNSSIDSGYTNSDLDTVSNDSEINLLRDSKNLSSGYNVLFGNNQYKQVLTRTNSTNYFSEKYLNKSLVHFFSNTYQNIWHIDEAVPLSKLVSNKVSFLYFDTKPADILNQTLFTTNHISSGKLYKIIDKYANQNIYYDYDSDGRLEDIYTRDSSNNYIYRTIYEYDKFDRVNKKTFYCSSRRYETTFHYLNDIENTIDSLVLYAETPNLNSYEIEESITLDPLKRISNLNQIDNGEYELNKDYNYHSSNNKTSVYPYRIDYSYTDNNNTSILQKSYYITYNSLANITSIKEGNTSSPTPLSGSDYVYDNLNQLTEEINYQTNIESRLVYSYDNNGNITSVNRYDLNNNLISTDSYSYHSYYKDLLISFNNNSITYDDALNPISYNGMTFAYSNRNKLISFTKNNVTFNYKYNYNGIRTEKTVDNILKVKYVLDGNRIIKEERQDLVNNTNINLIYLYGQQGLMGIIKDETLYRVITNVLGDVTYIYQGDTLLVHYVYDAYGNHKVLDSNNNEITNPTHIGLLNPFRYRSYYYDQESGLYYCNARYYYPVWRRWLTPDHYSYLDNKSLVGINLFAYCKNNPVMLYDPEGKSVFLTVLIFGIIVGAFFGAAFNLGVQLYENGWNIKQIKILEVVRSAIVGAAFGVASVLGAAAGTVALGASIAGYSLSMFASMVISVGTVSLASMVGYSLVALNDNTWKLSSVFAEGFRGAIQGFAVFSLGYFGGIKGASLLRFKAFGDINSLIPKTYFLKEYTARILLSLVSAAFRFVIDKMFEEDE
ncbi:MAG: hypothetical protein K6C32_04690 [Bacilli bacterium]|nr:hypothetical protein [Bacilli bacterium]